MHRRDDAPSGLRIALIASSFAPFVGGVEEHVARVAEQLSARGDEVEVWTVDRGARASSAGPSAAPFGVRYLPTPLPARSAPDLGRFALRAPGALSKWSRAVREFRPDVLSVQCFGPNGLYALGVHRRYGAPLIITSHGETLGDDNGVYARSALLRRGLRDALAAASAVTAPSEYVLGDLRERFGLGATDGVVIPNGVADVGAPASHDATLRQAQRSGSSVARRDDLLVAVGRLGRMKGFDLLIDAFVEADIPGAELEIVGDGPERTALQEQISRVGSTGRIRLAGQATAEGVASRMAAATAVVVPSRSEAFGIVGLEAWRSGAPLVMTSRGGAAEFVRDGEDGLLVDPTDRPALAAAIRRTLSDEPFRRILAANGRARLPEFEWARVAESYERLFRDVVGAGSAT
ncbi:glycosyltransferase family 4 protein [Microbacterium sp. AK031]|uniref:glycosyltransferase family 4 protein n=1 Tax=Microbacterium sp. AK031 TaxID=2723076 RepID=UPI002168781F|nr:glycosyltransferase family 4 protein [Microbacterium sp. AK031]MCS3841761.1 glycosyltransferase involved in cell wall biosynthesis [Microbacterium sp. AK031]